MKVRVTYTETFGEDELRALANHLRTPKVTRSDIRQLLEDLGRLGVEEIVADGEDDGPLRMG